MQQFSRYLLCSALFICVLTTPSLAVDLGSPLDAAVVVDSSSIVAKPLTELQKIALQVRTWNSSSKIASRNAAAQTAKAVDKDDERETEADKEETIEKLDSILFKYVMRNYGRVVASYN